MMNNKFFVFFKNTTWICTSSCVFYATAEPFCQGCFFSCYDYEVVNPPCFHWSSVATETENSNDMKLENNNTAETANGQTDHGNIITIETTLGDEGMCHYLHLNFANVHETYPTLLSHHGPWFWNWQQAKIMASLLTLPSTGLASDAAVVCYAFDNLSPEIPTWLNKVHLICLH